MMFSNWFFFPRERGRKGCLGCPTFQRHSPEFHLARVRSCVLLKIKPDPTELGAHLLVHRALIGHLPDAAARGDVDAAGIRHRDPVRLEVDPVGGAVHPAAFQLDEEQDTSGENERWRRTEGMTDETTATWDRKVHQLSDDGKERGSRILLHNVNRRRDVKHISDSAR